MTRRGHAAPLDPVAALSADVQARLAPFLALVPPRSFFDEEPTTILCSQGHEYGANRTPRGQYVYPLECPTCEALRIAGQQAEALRMQRLYEHSRLLARWNEAKHHGLDPAKTIAAWRTDYAGETSAMRRAGASALAALQASFPAYVNAIGTGRALAWLYADNNRGKSHYMHAIGWALHEVRVVFAVSCETVRDAFFAAWNTHAAPPPAAAPRHDWQGLATLAGRADVLMLDEVHNLAAGNGGDSYLFASVKAIIDANIARGGSLVLATNVAPAAVLDRWHMAGEGASQRALASRLGRDGNREYDALSIDFGAVLPWRRPNSFDLS